MHCNGVVYFSVIAWNPLEDLQNYSNYYSRFLAITGTAQSHKLFFISKLQNPVRIRFLLRKPESGSCGTQPESGSKKSKIQSMHTSGERDPCRIQITPQHNSLKTTVTPKLAAAFRYLIYKHST